MISAGRTLRTAAELLLAVLVGALVILAIASIYGPERYRPITIGAIPVVLVLLGAEVIALGLMKRLLLKMGLRNLIRHKGDTAIAIVGFMIGTAIICSSLVIGDTLTDLVQSLIYERYHLVDETVYVIDANGNQTFFDGELANEMADSIMSQEGAASYIDGISFEFQKPGSVFDPTTELLEPVMSIRAFSPASVDAFGDLYVEGRPIDLPLGPGEIALSKDAADALDAEVDHLLFVNVGVAEGRFTVRYILDDRGRASAFGGTNAFVSLPSAWDLYGLPYDMEGPLGEGGNWSGGSYNILYVSNEGGVVEGGDLSSKVVPIIDRALRDIDAGGPEPPAVRQDKGSGIEEASENLDLSIKVFVSLSAFSVIAGMTLIVNIFVMLSEERKEEMGISRAVGMQRSGLRLSYLFEGTAYSLISTLVGIVAGILAGFIIIYVLEQLVKNLGEGMNVSILSHYTVLPRTLMLAFSAGFGITLGTTLFITNRIARLNITSAIRGIPPSRVIGPLRTWLYSIALGCGREAVKDLACKVPGWLSSASDPAFLTGIALIIVGSLMAAFGISGMILWPLLIGISLAVIGVALISRTIIADRAVFTIAALLILLWWSVPLPFTEGYTSDIELFFFSGIFMVTAGVFIIVYNADILLAIVKVIMRGFRASPAPVKMAISYPMKKRFRTGVTIFMFALIIFTITGLSMVVHLFNINIDEFERSIGGGYDIIGISAIQEIPDLRATVIDQWGEKNASGIDWEHTSSLSIGIVDINVTMGNGDPYNERYTMAGVPLSFGRQNTYGFTSVDWPTLEGKGITDRTDEAVWSSLEHDELVIVDGTMGTNEFGPPGLGLSVGDPIQVTLPDGNISVKRIVAITDQFAIQAVFVSEGTASDQFNISQRTVHMIRVAPGADAGEVSDGLRRSLLRYGMFTIVIRELIREILSFQNSLFDLFNAYLSLGLIIGIVGLGIVTLRSVYERRHEIGMLRAIGFKKKGVVATFLGESSFIASSGLTLGSALGILLGYTLWRDEIQQELPVFGIPWGRILLVFAIAFTFSLLSSIPPANMAAKVAPAEALRYE